MFTPTVIAVRIYIGLNATPMADLKMIDGVIETIQWNDAKQRKNFENRINGYTFFYDERAKVSFENL